MAQTTLIQVRVDTNIKRKADTLFAELGLDTPTAIRIFLNHSIRREGLPFEVAKPQPNAETLAAMLEGIELYPKEYDTFGQILAEIDEELAAENDNV